jgi:sugar lactone lactonase YvrE
VIPPTLLPLSLCAFAATWSLVSSAASADPAGGPNDSFPKGGDYRATLPDLAGVCAVAFDGADLIVCVPEAFGTGAQVRRISRLNEQTPTATDFWINVDYAIDVAVSASGTIAVADAAGAVWVGGEVAVPADGSATRSEEWKLLLRDTSMRPSGVAWIGDRVAVSDSRSGEVLLVTPPGLVEARLGRGVLGEPRGLAAASDGTIFVADRLHDCLWRFDRAADGSYSMPPKRLAEPGFNPGQVSAPDDVHVLEKDGVRCLLVADELNHRVHVLSDQGEFVGFFGMHALVPRMGEGRIHYPRSLAVAADGVTLAVAEAFEDRVQIFGLKPKEDPVDASVNRAEFISSHFGSDAACAADLLVVHDLETESIAICDARTTPPIHMSIIGGGGALPQRFGEVTAVGVEPSSGRVWVADRVHSRIDVFDIEWDRSKEPIVDLFMPRLARSMDLERLVRGTDRRVPQITDIVLSAGGQGIEALLLDRANLGIHRADGRLELLAGASWIPLPAEARSPEELAVAPDGRLAVADPVARRVFVRDPSGGWTALSKLGWDFVRPSGVAFDERGQLVVSDAALDAVLVSDPQGARRVGGRGILDEQFYDPQSILASPKGLIVIDRGNHRFQRFGEGFDWNLTGSLGRYYDKKRKGSPGAAPASTPEAPGLSSPAASSRKGTGQ